MPNTHVLCPTPIFQDSLFRRDVALVERRLRHAQRASCLKIYFRRRLKAGFHMIADDRDRGSQIVKSFAIVCDHMETHFCDRLRSCDRDRRRSQMTAEDRTIFYLLRSSAMNCDRAIMWKPKFCDLRSKRIP